MSEPLQVFDLDDEALSLVEEAGSWCSEFHGFRYPLNPTVQVHSFGELPACLEKLGEVIGRDIRKKSQRHLKNQDPNVS
jgi:hypothetical protein